MSIDVKSDTLVARDEGGRTFVVDLKDRTVTESR
ncbi:protein of unknown function [Methylocaldum szegediense]|uniref:Uncharacterized protein n=1 Tax=Methylocaldum szegediense TaxID=73780 RepID=A0ABM9HZV0_9GAMM|nr:protein of unknown function [Methylocaldum szegediense]